MREPIVIGSAALYLGDCLEVLRTIPAASIDLVLCDPPYGTTRNKWDAVIPFAPMWAALDRVLKPGAAVVLTASQPFASALLMSRPDWFRHEWIWEKNKASGHLNAKRAPMKAHESALVFCERQPLYRPQKTAGHKPMNPYYTSHNGSNYGDGKQMTGGGSTERYPRSVQYFPVINNDDPGKTHPTQKPVDWMEFLIRTYSDEGMTVLDFAMGSGTTGEACRNTGRAFVGIDITPEYIEIARARIAPNLFATTED